MKMLKAFNSAVTFKSNTSPSEVLGPEKQWKSGVSDVQRWLKKKTKQFKFTNKKNHITCKGNHKFSIKTI